MLLNGELPQFGVPVSKWQLTPAQLPKTGIAVWRKAEVVFLYVAGSGELLMRDKSFILPSR